jgi:hypothetical protein
MEHYSTRTRIDMKKHSALFSALVAREFINRSRKLNYICDERINRKMYMKLEMFAASLSPPVLADLFEELARAFELKLCDWRPDVLALVLDLYDYHNDLGMPVGEPARNVPARGNLKSFCALLVNMINCELLTRAYYTCDGVRTKFDVGRFIQGAGKEIMIFTMLVSELTMSQLRTYLREMRRGEHLMPITGDDSWHVDALKKLMNTWK